MKKNIDSRRRDRHKFRRQRTHRKPAVTIPYGSGRLVPTNVVAFPKLLLQESLKNLIYELDEKKHKNDRIYCMNLAEAQRINLQLLRTKVAKCVVRLRRDGFGHGKSKITGDLLQKAMKEYYSALRDWDYIHSCHQYSLDEDPFKLLGSRMRDWAIFEEVELWDALKDKRQRRLPDVSKRPDMPSGGARSWKQSFKSRQALTRRLWFSMVGGAALIGPMILMKLQGDLVTTLTTASISTVLFAIVAAIFSDINQSALELLGFTAAYAAVMVVFVGTSS